MTLSEYSHLKRQICISVGKSERHAYLLETLKNTFKININSPRRFEKIITINDLLEVLELRNTLSDENVDALMQIAQMLPMPDSGDLAMRIKQYKPILKEPRNQYVTQAQTLPNRNPEGNGGNVPNCFVPVNGQISAKKRERILKTIVEEIGFNWRDLARNLKIREKIINDIDHTYKSLPNKVRKLLQEYFENKADPDRWFFELSEALDKTRRKDLVKSITEIITQNI